MEQVAYIHITTSVGNMKVAELLANPPAEERNAMQRPTCIHSDLAYTEDVLVCGVPLPYRFLEGAAHGWLCVKHYREQQDAMPKRPRKPLYADDSQIVRDLLRRESEAIANGKLETAWHAGVRLTFWKAA